MPSGSRPDGADLVLGGDIVVAGTQKVLATVKTGATKVVVNTDAFLPGEFTRNADFSLPTERLKRTIVAAAGRDNAHFIDASRIANALFGQSIGANMFMVGYAYQLGAVPLSASAIEKAIELNGEAVAMNKAAFHWGRRAVLDRAAVEALAKPAGRRWQATRSICRNRSKKRSSGGSDSSPPIRMPLMPGATGRWSTR